ncbi:hypothetical protein [Hydrogenophaga sp.]|uniref:hypothetical protein n=1 Tax=Hydrogenophaga sp. TaxID=1904254 RepID=UPI00286E18F2|nr:hypothetical protein [Hydrogenophaga sp.]
MNTVTFNTAAQGRPTWAKAWGLVSLAATAWALSAGQAQARGGQDDVYWSIGVSSPGVVVGVSNAPPPRPVVVYPQPVVVHQAAPVVIHQAYPYPYPYVRPVVVQPRPVVYRGWGPGPRWDDRHDRRHWKHRHHDRYDRDDRHDHGRDRWDDDDRRR